MMEWLFEGARVPIALDPGDIVAAELVIRTLGWLTPPGRLDRARTQLRGRSRAALAAADPREQATWTSLTLATCDWLWLPPGEPPARGEEWRAVGEGRFDAVHRAFFGSPAVACGGPAVAEPAPPTPENDPDAADAEEDPPEDAEEDIPPFDEGWRRVPLITFVASLSPSGRPLRPEVLAALVPGARVEGVEVVGPHAEPLTRWTFDALEARYPGLDTAALEVRLAREWERLVLEVWRVAERAAWGTDSGTAPAEWDFVAVYRSLFRTLAEMADPATLYTWGYLAGGARLRGARLVTHRLRRQRPTVSVDAQDEDDPPAPQLTDRAGPPTPGWEALVATWALALERLAAPASEDGRRRPADRAGRQVVYRAEVPTPVRCEWFGANTANALYMAEFHDRNAVTELMEALWKDAANRIRGDEAPAILFRIAGRTVARVAPGHTPEGP